MSTEMVSNFEQFLVNSGLKCVRREGPASVNNYTEIEFAGTGVRVRLSRDRGSWNLRVADPVIASDLWYDVRLFTYLLDGRAQPKMPFEKQLEFAKSRWPEILSAFGPDRRVKTHMRLAAAKEERATTIYMNWPPAVRDLESFMLSNGLACVSRKDARFMYDSMALIYADSRIAVRVRSQPWRVELADMSHDPDRWYGFSAIRKAIQWPEDHPLTFLQTFDFFKANWLKIASMFAPETSKETRERLDKIEQATAMPLGKGTD